MKYFFGKPKNIFAKTENQISKFAKTVFTKRFMFCTFKCSGSEETKNKGSGAKNQGTPGFWFLINAIFKIGQAIFLSCRRRLEKEIL